VICAREAGGSVFQAEDGVRDRNVTGVQTCALPIWSGSICEVGPRDGSQIEPDFIPTELKVEVVNLLAEAAVPRIEVTSFVHPKVVPQLRDAEEVMAKIRRRPGTRYAALVPNDKGAVRAVDAGVDAIHTVVSASESHRSE